MAVIPTHQEYLRRAEPLADAIASKPKFEPGTAGLTGMIAVFVAILVFILVAGLDTERHAVQLCITVVVGFIGPYFYYRRIGNKYELVRYRIARELEEKDKMEGANAHRT